MFVDHLLLVDQVGRLHHEVHQLVGVATPRVKSLQRILIKRNGLELRPLTIDTNNMLINQRFEDQITK